MEDSNKIIDRIRKLMAKANDPSVTEAESLAYASKAQSLLEEHNLKLVDLTTEEENEGISAFTWDPKYGSRAWRRLVAINAAKVYMCRLVMTNAPVAVRGGKIDIRPCFILVGRESSIAVAQSMIDYLLATGFRLSKGYSSVEKERRSFEEGYGIRMSQRLKEMHQASAVKASDSSGLPALYRNEEAATKDWMDQNMKGNTDKTVRAVTKDHHGKAGMLAANNVSLNTQVEGGAPGAPALPKGALLLGSS